MNQRTSKFSNFSNFVFINSILILLIYIWLNFYIKRSLVSFCITLFLSVLINIIYYFINSRLNSKKSTKKKIEQNKNNFKKYLQFNKRDMSNKYLLSKFEFSNLKKINNIHYYSKHENFDVYIFLNPNDINEISIYNERISNKIIILSVETIEFKYKVKNIQIEYYNFDNIYALCQDDIDHINQNNLLEEKNPKLNIKDILPLIFTKKNYKKFLSLGILLLFSSLLTMYKIYYLIFSSLLLITSIYCKYNKKYNI